MASGEDLRLDRLRALIGRYARYDGTVCQIIELLEDEPSLVLSCADRRTVIQPNQYGEATRRAPKTHTIPVYSPDGQEINPEFLALDILD